MKTRNVLPRHARHWLLTACMALPLLTFASASASASAGEGAPGHTPMLRPGAEPDPHGPAHGVPPHGPRFDEWLAPSMDGRPPLLRGVVLAEAQQDQVFAILHAEQPTLREQAKVATKAQEALRALAHAERYDDGKALALSKEVGAAMAAIALQRARLEQKLLAVLTPAQRQRWALADAEPSHPLHP